MKIIALATLLAFTGAPTGAHHLVGSEFGPAKYGDRCSLDSEMLTPDAYIYRALNGRMFLVPESRQRYFKAPDTVTLPMGRIDLHSLELAMKRYMKQPSLAATTDIVPCFSKPWNGQYAR